MNKLTRPALFLFALCLSACASPAATPSGAARTYPVDTRGAYQRKIAAAKPEAAELCRQGLVLLFAFNHQEATRRFQRAAEADPNCAMAYWGIAFAAGPHINNPAMNDERNKRANDAIAKALANKTSAAPVERALIDALSKRYADPPPADRKPLDEAFANAMRDVYQQYKNDPDVGAFFAESLMDLRPWDLWSKSGEPRPETPEIVATLDHVLEIAPHHPLANHLMIHAVEASLHPDKAEAAADRLRELIPETGHLVHMPSHIDIRLGNYEKAINANKKAVAADKIFVEAAGPGGFMAMYRAHNYHFLVYGAMFDGQSKLALTSARELLQAVPASVAETMPDVLDGFLATPYHVMERFGMWDAILAEPAPDAKFAVTNAMWHFSRGLAYSSLGKLVEAAGELAAYERACEKVSGSATIGNNKAKAVLAVGQSLLTGELAYRAGRADEGFAHLREAVKRDDNLAYDEPWGWMQPVRHALGALLLEAGRVEDARDVYAKDLELHPHNGWALHGLAECQRKLGQADEAKKTEALFNAAWARADIKINASCFCRTK